MSIFWFEKDANYQFLFKRNLKRRAARNVKSGKGIIDVKLMEPYFELPWDKHAQFMAKRVAKLQANKRAREHVSQSKEFEEDCSNYYVPVEDDTPSPPKKVATLATFSFIDAIVDNMRVLPPIEDDAPAQARQDAIDQAPPLALVASLAPLS